jgi:hypothetical protein
MIVFAGSLPVSLRALHRSPPRNLCCPERILERPLGYLLRKMQADVPARVDGISTTLAAALDSLFRRLSGGFGSPYPSDFSSAGSIPLSVTNLGDMSRHIGGRANPLPPPEGAPANAPQTTAPEGGRTNEPPAAPQARPRSLNAATLARLKKTPTGHK